MRIEFHREVGRLRTNLADMCGLAGLAARDATRAALDSDCAAATATLACADRLTARREVTEGMSTRLLALQAPVAGDLRMVVAAIRIAADVERMGRLVGHVAEASLRYQPGCVVPAELRAVCAAMGRIATDVAECCQRAVRTGDCARVQHVCDAAREMERLHRTVFETVSAPGWAHGPMAAADMVLLGRFYGRFADHAADVARQVNFQRTGTKELAGVP